MEIKRIFEDMHILAVIKPSGIAAQGDKTGDEDLMTILGGNLFLVHRLDRPVGGIILYAKTQAAAAKLSKQISDKTIQKEYLVVVMGSPVAHYGELSDHLKKLRTVNMSKVVQPGTPGSKEARLSYSLIETVETDELGVLSLLSIKLQTGRHHQIRVQLSNAGFPIWGDTKYNRVFMKKKGWSQIALWSSKLSFNHPEDNRLIELTSLPPNEEPWNLFDFFDKNEVSV